VEAVDKDLLRRHFTNASGNLYEGTLSDFTPPFIGTFDLKTNETLAAASERSDLAAVAAALTASDAELLSRLQAVIDMDELFDYWAMESVLRHWDGYANNNNNFFVYDDPSTRRFVFLPWGADAVMDPAATAGGGNTPTALFTKAELARRLWGVPAARD